jgi:hypothetical protein
MHVSVVSFLNPYKVGPDGGSEDIRRRLEALAQHFTVNLYVMDKVDRLDVKERIPEGINAHFYSRRFFPGCQSLMWPYPVASRYNNALLEKLNADLTLHGGVLVCEGLQVFSVYRSIPREIRNQCKTVLRVHNIESHYHEQMARTEENVVKKFAHRLTRAQYERLEGYAYEEFNALHCISSDESKFLLGHVSSSTLTRLVPPLTMSNVVTPQKTNTAGPFNVCIFGDYSLPVNRSGAEWFLKNVWRHVPANFNLHVAGKESDMFTTEGNVLVHGFVDDINKFLSQMHFVVLPVLCGAGVKIKTVDAIASGLPVISTKHAVTGLPNTVTSSVFSSDEPSEHIKFLQQAILNYDNCLERARVARTSLFEYCHPDKYISEIKLLCQNE